MNDKAVTDLLPCPFCGPDTYVSCEFDEVLKRYRVYCGACGSSSGISIRDKTPQPAIAAWNRRSESSQLAALRSENGRLREALAMFYDKWEDGTDCYEDPEDCTGYLGKAVNLNVVDEEQILALIPPERSALSHREGDVT